MARNTSVSLNDHLAGFIDEQVSSGHYASASDVVRAGLELLEEHEVRLTALHDALRSGEKGPFIPFDRHVLLAELNERHDEENR